MQKNNMQRNKKMCVIHSRQRLFKAEARPISAGLCEPIRRWFPWKRGQRVTAPHVLTSEKKCFLKKLTRAAPQPTAAPNPPVAAGHHHQKFLNFPEMSSLFC